MLKKRLFSALLAVSLLLIPTTVWAADEDSKLTISGADQITGTETPTLKAEGGEGDTGYTWYRNNEKIEPEKDPNTGKPLPNSPPTDRGTLTTNRSGEYYFVYDGKTSEKVRIYHDIESGGSSSLLIGRNSSNITQRQDSKIQKLEAKVAKAEADAEKPHSSVTLGTLYSAVDAATASGGAVTLYDAGTLGTSTQDVLRRRIGEAGLPDRLFADVVVGNRVTTRLSLVPSQLSATIELGVSLGDAAMTKKFTDKFSNSLLVIDAAQQGSYGQTVEFMVSAGSLSGAQELSFYRYDAKTNLCTPITVSGLSLDQNGYLHFCVSSGGILVVSQGELTNR